MRNAYAALAFRRETSFAFLRSRRDARLPIAMGDGIVEAWKDFFVAEVGAASALAGLLIVAMSINIAKILEHSILPARAAQTMAVIGGVLVVASFGLFPGQPLAIFGAEVIAVGLAIAITGVYHFHTTGRTAPAEMPFVWRFTPLLSTELTAIILLVAGLLLVAGHEEGLYVVACGVVAALAVTLMSGWVLLIEILR
jgi:hypothetical protein